jgi:hypothetical protein
VYGLAIQENFNDLVVGTYGRGFWVLDDLTALQRLTPTVLAADAHLFAPRPAYRWRDIPGNYNMDSDQTAGLNPTYGAGINYWLKSRPTGPVVIEILDSTRKVVRTLRENARSGINRSYWNLRGETPPQLRLRTKPMHNEDFELDSAGTRVGPTFGGFSVLMPPGRYTVRLTVNGIPYTQPLTVVKDPNNMATLAEIHDQTRALMALQRDHAAAAAMVNTIEDIRSQLQALKPQLAADSAGADSLDRKFISVEERLIDLRQTGRGQDGVRWPVRLGGQLDYVASGIAASDFGPTAQAREVAAVLAKETRDVHAALTALINSELPKYNEILKAKGLRQIEAQLSVP